MGDTIARLAALGWKAEAVVGDGSPPGSRESDYPRPKHVLRSMVACNVALGKGK